ncbi:MAG: aspartate-semialdehyde dehydrogenase [Candidatus Eiseniibacteriota bacterium]|nr:MAG: aspartate-semialdehyde dehydrogenase [Candidatus Eisenbacteria bacterium]
MPGFCTAIIGATGAVGAELIRIIQEREFPVSDLRLFASERSQGKLLEFRGGKHAARALSASELKGVEVVFISAGGAVSKEYAPVLAQQGALVVDNSSAFRGDQSVPLVIPEINGHEVVGRRGIVANPNCSTIQLVLAVEPVHRIWGLERLVVATYQSVSGTGGRAMQELRAQSMAYLEGRPLEKSVYPVEIGFNLFPHIGEFGEDGLHVEERKIVQETRRFLRDESLSVTVTAVRVPVFRSHSEAVVVTTRKKTSAREVADALRSLPGICLMEGPDAHSYATPAFAEGRDEVFVGRVRDTHPEGHGISMWVVADNLRKGAALNAVQIAEHAMGLV